MTSEFIPPDPRRTAAQHQQMLDLSLTTDVVCESCNNLTFQQVLLIKKVSALVSRTGKEGIAPIPTFACAACGYVNEMFRVDDGKESDAPTNVERRGLTLEK